jgi:hypothetical protein
MDNDAATTRLQLVTAVETTIHLSPRPRAARKSQFHFEIAPFRTRHLDARRQRHAMPVIRGITIYGDRQFFFNSIDTYAQESPQC